jgi:hypothetical protein
MTSSPLTLHIEARPEGERIAGRLRDGGGIEHQFTGWLGLLTLLEQARLTLATESTTQGERP